MESFPLQNVKWHNWTWPYNTHNWSGISLTRNLAIDLDTVTDYNLITIFPEVSMEISIGRG